MNALHLPSALEQSDRILIAGAGGGFDVYAGLPIFARLRALGKTVFLANLSFTYLGGTDAKKRTPALYVVEPKTEGGEGHFPERALARFLAERGEDATVYAIDKCGVVPVREAYAYLAKSLAIDARASSTGASPRRSKGASALTTGTRAPAAVRSSSIR